VKDIIHDSIPNPGIELGFRNGTASAPSGTTNRLSELGLSQNRDCNVPAKYNEKHQASSLGRKPKGKQYRLHLEGKTSRMTTQVWKDLA
jgi:hypothetical protein